MLIILSIYNILIYHFPKKNSFNQEEVCKYKMPFKTYWEEKNIQYIIKTWYYDEENYFYIRFDIIPKTEGLFEKTTFIEIYDKKNAVDQQYYINNTDCIKDIFNLPVQKFDTFKEKECIYESNYLKIIPEVFDLNVFNISKWCHLRSEINK